MLANILEAAYHPPDNYILKKSLLEEKYFIEKVNLIINKIISTQTIQ